MINTFYSIGRLQKRLLVIVLLMTFLFGAIFLRLSYIQLINGEWLQAKALDQWTRDVPIKAKRGTIYDTNGSAIAVNYATYDVYVRAKNVEKPKELAKKLKGIMLKIKVKAGENGKIFGGVTSKEISENLKSQYNYIIDKKKIDLKENIKTLGEFNVSIKLYEGVVASLKIQVISE